MNWAVDAHGRLVSPIEATSREGLNCPDPACNSRLSLHAGEILVRHFAHLGEERCSNESREHWSAKHKLADVVGDAIAGRGPWPTILRRCPECGVTKQQEVSKTVRSVRVEAPLGPLRIDVLLEDESRAPLCAVEVFWSHDVSGAKAEELPIHWVELEASEVLADPLEWRPRQDGLRRLRCACIARREPTADGLADAWDDVEDDTPEYEVRIEYGAIKTRGLYDFRAMPHALAVVNSWLTKRLASGRLDATTFVRVSISTGTRKVTHSWRSGKWLGGGRAHAPGRRPPVARVQQDSVNREHAQPVDPQMQELLRATDVLVTVRKRRD